LQLDDSIEWSAVRRWFCGDFLCCSARLVSCNRGSRYRREPQS